MNGKILLMLLAAALTVGLFGCKREGGTAKQTRTPTREGTTTPGETARTPGATPEAPSEVGKAPGTAPGTTTPAPGAPGTGTQATAQMKQQYIAGAEKMLTSLEQQAQSVNEAQVAEADRDKATQLKQDLQQQIATARQTLTKLRDAPPDAWANIKVAADNAIQNAQNTYKQLQTIAGQGQRQVTQQQ
jgi:uncharacterized phage infection (PIP) family protein YhgE